MKKKILFTAYSLGLGGIEKALVNLLNNPIMKNYDVTLILEKKEGIFLEMIPDNVRILEYKISNSSNVLYRKLYNRMKLLKWKLSLYHKFDFSCSFSTYSIPGAHLALSASKNNTLWMHANYYITYGKNQEKMADFLNSVKAYKFNRVVFVSSENMRDVTKHYPKICHRSIVCNNLIDYKNILNLSKEKVDFKRKKITTFVNVGRHEEYQKRLSRIIKATHKLKEEGYKFQILFIGDGPDTEKYQKMVCDLDVEKYIIFLGRKQNPYPYFNLADAVLLSSEYEGYPVVFLESMVLNKPIISTKVSDYESLENKNGIFVDCNTESVYQGMKKFLDEQFKIVDKFQPEIFNQQIEEKIIKMIECDASEK